MEVYMSEIAVASPPTASRWEDFLDILISPRELFDRRKDESPTKPFLMLAAVCFLLYYVFMALNGDALDAAIASGASAADTEKLAKAMGIMKWVGGLMMPIGLAIGVGFCAVALKLATWMFEPSGSWRQVSLIATFSAFVAVPQQILGAVLMAIKGRAGSIDLADANFSVMQFLDRESMNPVLAGFLGRVEVFEIWSAVLLAIGLMIVVKMPRNSAIASAAFTWVATSIPAILSSLMTASIAR
jgi:hypothetical protein